MKEEKTTPLRQRMIEDMDIRGLCEKTQQGHIRCVKHFASFLGRSPLSTAAQNCATLGLCGTRVICGGQSSGLSI
jgi:hypothetical protein